ncbi:MAG: hypothetical protein DRP42_01615 [Tenericutes bacterium]|nr:MAG: hypothetical protein DRP42_01615 [Mycoplasmatota bacterium]
MPGELSDEQEFINKRYKAIADFSRSTTFALSDGASIGPTGRGYVLRRLLRKAAIYGKALGMNTEFIYKLVPVIADIMKDFYPEVSKNADKIQDLIKKEETTFLNTLTKASLLLEDELSKLDSKTLPAKIGFKLFESHGLPFEVLNDLLTEKGISIDKDEFDKLFEDFSELSKSNAKQTEGMSQQENRFRGQESTKFIGYDNVESNSKVIAIENDGTNTFVAFDTTPFYATSGGQEFDTGTIDNEQVISVQKNGDNVFIHEVLGVHE